MLVSKLFLDCTWLCPTVMLILSQPFPFVLFRFLGRLFGGGYLGRKFRLGGLLLLLQYWDSSGTLVCCLFNSPYRTVSLIFTIKYHLPQSF